MLGNVYQNKLIFCSIKASSGQVNYSPDDKIPQLGKMFQEILYYFVVKGVEFPCIQQAYLIYEENIFLNYA